MSSQNAKPQAERATGKVCKRCDSTQVFLSKYRGLEGILPAIASCNVYRCLGCYHRFWAYENFFANPVRAWLWGIILFLAVVLMFLGLSRSSDLSQLNRKAELIPQFESQAENIDAPVDLSANDPVTSALSRNDVVNDFDEALTSLPDDVIETSKLEVAQAESERIKSAFEESNQRLESAVVEDEQALSSLLKIDINHRINGWREAWQAGNVSDYLTFYSLTFQPNGGLSYNAWQEQRKARVTPSKKIELVLSDFDVTFADENRRAIAIFTQSYESPTYSEKSQKKLVLLNEGDDWNIVSEETVN